MCVCAFAFACKCLLVAGLVRTRACVSARLRRLAILAKPGMIRSPGPPSHPPPLDVLARGRAQEWLKRRRLAERAPTITATADTAASPVDHVVKSSVETAAKELQEQAAKGALGNVVTSSMATATTGSEENTAKSAVEMAATTPVEDAAKVSDCKEEDLGQPQTPPQPKLETLTSTKRFSLAWQVHVQNQLLVSLTRELIRVNQELQSVKDNNSRLHEEMNAELKEVKQDLGTEQCNRYQMHLHVGRGLQFIKEEVRLLKEALQHEKDLTRRLQTQLQEQPQQRPVATWRVEGWC